jgi:hypothetical protein
MFCDRIHILVSLVLLPLYANGWVNLRESGQEITFQTNLQVGDWDFGTTGTRDLYITGDVHVGKAASAVRIAGDINLRTGTFFADEATVLSSILTPEARSNVSLRLHTGPGEDLVFSPGFLGELESSSDILVEHGVVSSKRTEAKSELDLGDLEYDVAASTFSGSTVTFAPALAGSLLLNQLEGPARLLIESTGGGSPAAKVELKNSDDAEYTLQSTGDGIFELGLLDKGIGTRLFEAEHFPDANGTAVDVADHFKLKGALNVAIGSRVTGGVVVENFGMNLKDGAAIVDGMTLADTGFEILTGILDVSEGGLSVTDGVVLNDAGLTVRLGGGEVDLGGLRVVAGGARVETGGLVIQHRGLNITGGVRTDHGGVVLAGGATVSKVGAIVHDVGMVIEEGTLRVEADGAEISGGLTLTDTGFIVVNGGSTITAGGLNVTGGVVITDAGLTVAEGGFVADRDGVNITGGLNLTDVGLLLDGRSLKYVGSAMISDGHVRINEEVTDSHSAVLGVKTSWGSDRASEKDCKPGERDCALLLGQLPDVGNGDGRLLARGGSSLASFTITITKARDSQVASDPYFSWYSSTQGLALEYQLERGVWVALADGVEIMFPERRNGKLSDFEENDQWTVLVEEIAPFRIRNAAGESTFRIEPNGTFKTSSNFTVEQGLTVSDGLEVQTQICAAFDARGNCVEFDVGLEVADQGANIGGGLVVSDTGLRVAGATEVVAGGASVSGGVRVGDTGVTISNGGLQSGSEAVAGTLRVESDGLHVVQGGIVLTDTGMQVGGGAHINGAFTVAEGVIVNNTGIAVQIGDVTLQEGMLAVGAPQPDMMVDIHSKTADIVILFLPSHDSADDLTVSGVYTGYEESTFDIEIDVTGNPDTFKWRKCTYHADSSSCNEPYIEGATITHFKSYLIDGISISFAAVTGHQRRDRWRIDVKPTNPLSASQAPGVSTPNFLVGQDGTVHVGNGAWVAGGITVSAARTQVGQTQVVGTGLIANGGMKVGSSGIVVSGELAVTSGVIINAGDVVISAASGHAVNVTSKNVGVVAGSVEIQRDGLVIGHRATMKSGAMRDGRLVGLALVDNDCRRPPGAVKRP